MTCGVSKADALICSRFLDVVLFHWVTPTREFVFIEAHFKLTKLFSVRPSESCGNSAPFHDIFLRGLWNLGRRLHQESRAYIAISRFAWGG